MEGPRAPLEREYPELLKFLNESLRPNQGWSIQDEYPTTLNPSQRNNSRVITRDGKLVAHSILKPMLIKTPSTIFKVGAIGSVVTHPEYRGQGLAKSTLLSVVDEAGKQGCDIAILWTNLYDYYRKLNFELAGSEISFLIQQDISTPTTDYTYMNNAKIAPEAILRLYQQHTVATYRTAEDIRQYLKIPQARVYTAWDKSGNIAAYAIEGKGADLQNHVHEWGGSVPAIMALLGHMFRERKAPFSIMVPGHSVNLISQLVKKSGNIHEGYLGMVKLCREDLLFPKIQRAAYSVGLKDFSITPDNGGYVVRAEGSEYRLENERDLVRAMFSPVLEESIFPEHFALKVSRLFPMPIWVWGWDSV